MVKIQLIELSQLYIHTILRKRWSWLSVGSIPLIAYLLKILVPGFGGDFIGVFYPVLFEDNPYNLIGYMNPPWLVWLLYPLRYFDVYTASALWMSISIHIIIYVMWTLDADLLSYVLVFTNPLFFVHVAFDNIEVLVLLGFVMESSTSVLLLALKPQLAVTLLLKRVVMFDESQLRLIINISIGSFVVYGFWVVDMLGNWFGDGLYHPISIDIFPYGVPIGIILILWSLIEENDVVLLISSMFIVPYIAGYTLFIYTVLMFCTFKKHNKIVIYVITWLFFIVALHSLEQ